MAYTNLAKIKEWLQGVSSSADAELVSIQNDVTLEINRRLSLVTALPITDQTVRDELGVFEARLVALWFKYRRVWMEERESIINEINEAWIEFDKFLTNRFGYGVVIG